VAHDDVVAIGVFKERQQARRAILELRRAGFHTGLIGVVAKDKKIARDLESPPETHAEEGAVAGAAAGTAVGVLWGLGVAAGLISPLGPVLVGGALAAVLASAVTGAAAAGLAGFLIGLGIPEHETAFCEKELKAGRILLTVKGGRRNELARTILRRNQGYDIEARPLTRKKSHTPSAKKAG
jgi:hypothetical protein